MPKRRTSKAMNRWGQFPFVRLLFPFIAGIISSKIWNVEPKFLHFYLLGSILLFLIVVIFMFRYLSYSWRWVVGPLILFILFLGGFIRTNQQTYEPGTDDAFLQNNSSLMRVELIEPLSEKPKSFKTVGRIVNAKDSLSWKAMDEKVLIYFEKNKSLEGLDYGDQILISAKLQAINPPLNPGEFDYRKYLQNQGINFRVYIKKNDWKLLQKGVGNPLIYFGLELRKSFLNILVDNGLKGPEFAVASALLLGYDDYLDRDQKQQFAGAGIMHILCVSGLHVGILAFLLEFLLGFMDRKKILSFAKLILIICTIWLYAAITGFSPSVMRAATMFSFIMLGRSQNRKANVFNMLAASAFFLLLYQPLLLTQVGFQLSYIAMLGIVLLYKPIYSLLNISIKLFDAIWKITVVSLAATIATLPLSLYYFHQFPVLFLFTNLVAIPAATLIIYLGLLVLLSSFFPGLSNLFAWLLIKVIWILNYFVAWIDGLSFSVIKGIYISTPEMLVLFLFLMMLVFFIHLKKKFQGVIAILLAFLFVSMISLRRINSFRQKQMIVYGVRKSTAIDFIHGKKAVMLCDSAFRDDSLAMNYSVLGNRIKSGINEAGIVELKTKRFQNNWIYKNQGFVSFLGQRILIVTPATFFVAAAHKMPVDYILLSNNPKISMKQLSAAFLFKEIIFDLSTPPWKVKQWRDECNELKLPFYDIRERGAWINNI